MSATLRALKQEVETISGMRQGQSKGAPAVFVQAQEPRKTLSATFKTGDFWINPDTKQLWFYNDNLWVRVV
jgi:lipopolysaccharide export system protein LptA